MGAARRGLGWLFFQDFCPPVPLPLAGALARSPLSDQGPFPAAYPPPLHLASCVRLGAQFQQFPLVPADPRCPEATPSPRPAAAITDPGLVHRQRCSPGLSLAALQHWLGPSAVRTCPTTCSWGAGVPASRAPPTGLRGAGRGSLGSCRCAQNTACPSCPGLPGHASAPRPGRGLRAWGGG